MSLVGNLEELGLGEILQIVSLSRKTGVLSLSSSGRDGSVFFRQGQVVRASSSIYVQSLGEVLIQKEVVDLATLRKALAFQQENGFRERLGVILVKNYGVSQNIIDEVVREQIENVVFSLFAWSEGTFRFEVRSSIETVDRTQMDPMQFMLDQGLNPQFLAMEGTRILDEKRYANEQGFTGSDTSDDATDFTFDLVDDPETPTPVPHVEQQPFVIVDDDGPTLRFISDGLTQRGFIVHAMTRSEDTLIMVDSLHRSGGRPTVLIDLIMPKMDGSGVLGGIELLELLHKNFNNLQLIVMTDYHHSEAEILVRELGYRLVFKPRRGDIANHAVMDSFLDRITADDSDLSAGELPREQESRFDLGNELRLEMGEHDEPANRDDSPQSGGFSLLHGMLEELSNPDLQDGVPLLVLRFASEFVNRAIIFTIKDRIVSGFGQFGITGGTISGNERIRTVRFKLESGSMFDEPFRTGHPNTFSPIPTSLDSDLFELLGGGIPTEVFVGPLVSQSRVIGFLYGDNIPDMQPIGDVGPLTIFLEQAGMALEKSLPERQLNERVTT